MTDPQLSDAASGLSDEEYGRPSKSKIKQRLSGMQRGGTVYVEDSLGENGDGDSDKEELDPWPDEDKGGVGLDDLNLARIKRVTLEAFIEEPFISKAINDCFVRYMIGEHHGTATYRVCQVKDVTQRATSYRLPGSKKSTNQMLLLSIAGSTKEGKIDKVSNHRFTQQELETWRSKMRDARAATVTPADCKRLHQRTKEVINNHTYTPDEVQEMVAKKSKAAVVAGRMNLAQARIRLANDKGACEQEIRDARECLSRLREGTEKFDRCEEELCTLERRLKGIEGDEEAVTRHQQFREDLLRKNDKLSSVNVKNRSQNVEVDGVDSREMLRLEFLGGDAANDAFRTTRTRMVDLWKTASYKTVGAATDRKNDFSFATTEEREYVKHAYKMSSRSFDNAGGSSQAKAFARSERGLKRPMDPSAPRMRKGISLNEYLKQARRAQGNGDSDDV